MAIKKIKFSTEIKTHTKKNLTAEKTKIKGEKNQSKAIKNQ